MSDGGVILSMKVTEFLGHPVLGSVKHPCDTCGEDLWIAPVSQGILEESERENLGVRVMCSGCLFQEEPPDEVEVSMFPKDFLDGVRGDKEG